MITIKENETNKKRRFAPKLLGVLIVLVTLGSIGFAVYALLSGTRTISTGNASVTTDLVRITATTPGLLERFDLYEGMRVEAGQLIGWLQDGETFRSPIDGVVVHTNATAGQHILPMENLATIANTHTLHIQANFYESDLLDIHLGQPVAVTLDAVRGETFEGYVQNIGRITELELAGGATMVQTGTFRRITHTVPVQISLVDDIDLSAFLGTNARVSLPVLSAEEALTLELPAPINHTRTHITASGTVESVTSRNLYSAHMLRIDDVLVQVGDVVEVGQILATLDTADLETARLTGQATINQLQTQTQIQTQDTQRRLDAARQNLAGNTNPHLVDAQANLTISEQQLDNAQRLYDEALQDFENQTNPHVMATERILRNAQLELDRLQADYHNFSILYTAGAMPRQEMQQFRNAIESAEHHLSDAIQNHQNTQEAQARHLQQVREALESATLGVQMANDMAHSAQLAAQQEIDNLQSSLQLSRIDPTDPLRHNLTQIERQLQDGVIVSPIRGTVTAAHAQTGEFALGRLFTIETLDDLRVLATVREYDLPDLAVGKAVNFTAYATGEQRHTGVITRISPRAVVTQPTVMFEIEIQVTSDYPLSPGMSATVHIER